MSDFEDDPAQDEPEADELPLLVRRMLGRIALSGAEVDVELRG